MDYYQVGGDDDDDDGNDHYDYDEDEFDGGWPFLDHPVAEGLIPYSYCGFRKSFLCSEPPPQLPRTSPTALDARLDRLPAPCRNWLTPEVGSSPCRPLLLSRGWGSPGDITRGIPPQRCPDSGNSSCRKLRRTHRSWWQRRSGLRRRQRRRS